MAAIKQGKKRGLLTAAATVTVLAGIAAGILITMGVRGEALVRSDAIFPKVSIAGIPVGGMTAEEAELAVKTAVQTRGAVDFDIHLPDRTLTLDADNLSPAADLGDAVTRAMTYGRTGTGFDALAAQKAAVDLPARVTLTYDESYIRQVLDAAAADAVIAPTLPAAQRNYREKAVTVTLGTDGRRLDCDRLLPAVVTALQAGEASLQWDYTAVPAPLPDLNALHETTGGCFDLAQAQALLAAAAAGETVTIPTE